MASEFRTWWQKNKRLLIAVTAVMMGLLVVSALIYWFGWDWTGFTGYSPPTPQYQRGKTLWDWLQLLAALAIPVVVGFGAAWFTAKQNQANEATNKQQRETELEIAIDNQRETALQA